MPRNYSPEQMRKALLEVSKGMNFLTASKKFGIPRTSLKSKFAKKYKKGTMGPAATLPEKYENDLVLWLTSCAKNGFPINREQLCDSVKRMVVDFAIPNKFKDNRPGYKWVTLFLKRHPSVTVHKSQLQEKVRKEVTQQKIDHWFSELEKFVDEENLQKVMNDPFRVFNCDESAFFLAPGKNYVLVPRTEKRTFSITGNNDKENFTVLIGSNAAGNLMPPMIVFKYERIPKSIIDSVPKEWGVGRSENGWMTCAVFYEYMTNVFLPWLKNNKIKMPIILFLDGHVSHLSYQLSDFCLQNQIHLFALYPHATHLLQPMDVAVFKQMKDKWKRAVINWKFENNEVKLPKEKFAQLLQTVLFSVTGIENGFRKCGLHPFGRISIADTPNYSRNEDEDDSPQLSWSERFKFLRFIESEIGKSKIKLFKEEKVSPEDETLFQMWRKLHLRGTDVTNSAVSTPLTSITVPIPHTSSSFIDEPREINISGVNIIEDFELSHTPPTHSTPVAADTVHASPNKSTNSSPNCDSPRRTVSTPVKMLPWPKYVPKKKSGSSTSGSKNETNKVPFAITSKAWQTIFREKEAQKEKLEQEKQDRKLQREQKRLEKEENDRKRKASRKNGPRKKKKIQILEDEDSDFEMNLDEVESPSKNSKPSDNAEHFPMIKTGDFVVGKLIYNFGTKKETQKYFIGQVLLSQSSRQQSQCEVSFLRKNRAVSSENVAEYYFTFPNIIDKWRLSADQIVEAINLVKTLRGKYYFDFSSMKTCIEDIE